MPNQSIFTYKCMHVYARGYGTQAAMESTLQKYPQSTLLMILVVEDVQNENPNELKICHF